MAIARFVNGEVVDRREGVDLADISEQKRQALGWKSLVYVGEGSVEHVEHTDDTITITRSTPAPTVDDVARERQRRFDMGFVYNFGDERGQHLIGTTRTDLEGWREVTDIANAAIAVGQPNTSISILTNTGPVSITAAEWQLILIAASEARQPLWAKSFILQAMSPIPSDYTSDSYWT